MPKKDEDDPGFFLPLLFLPLSAALLSSPSPPPLLLLLLPVEGDDMGMPWHHHLLIQVQVSSQ